MPTPTLEEYLETIYKLGSGGSVRPTAIAESIGVSGPTVTATLKRLESRGLVTREGTSVVLTGEGETLSLDIIRKHRIAERFLVDVLGLDWEAAHEDACLLEHALSGRVLEALERFLDSPDVCPHGHPIPRQDGSLAQAVPGQALSLVEAAGAFVVLRVDEDERLLGYLESIGLVPGSLVEVSAVEPNGGPLLVSIAGEVRALGREVARHVIVRPSEA